jgi:peptidoglycan/LPS O-acetylase OafA/YrhL
MKLEHLMHDRDNNFNLIRIIAALTVIFNHGFVLRGVLDPIESLNLSTAVGTMTMGSVAVDFFFIVSGFLVTASLLYKQSTLDFIWARILRIYPALIVMVILCISLLGLYFTRLPTIEFLNHRLTHLFAIKNMTLITGVIFNLPGVEFNSHQPFRVNTPIYTLLYEILMYSALALMWALLFFLKSKREKLFSLSIIFVAISLLIFQFVDYFYFHWSSLYARFCYLFFSGAAFFILKDKIIISNCVFLLMLVSLLTFTTSKNIFFVLYSVFLAYIVIWLAYVPRGNVRRFNRFGDYSYGMYIYSLPVQQTLCTIFAGIGILRLTITSIAITYFMAYLSWHLIEKKALSLKRIKVASAYKKLFLV